MLRRAFHLIASLLLFLAELELGGTSSSASPSSLSSLPLSSSSAIDSEESSFSSLPHHIRLKDDEATTRALLAASPSHMPSSSSPSPVPTLSPSRRCPLGSTGRFCDTCSEDYFSDPLDSNACQKCSEKTLSGYAIFGLLVIGVCCVLCMSKYYLENMTIPIYVHDYYHTDTWLVKLKAQRLIKNLLAMQGHVDPQSFQAVKQKANAEMLEFDIRAEAKLDAFWAKLKIYASFFQFVALLPVIFDNDFYQKFKTLATYFAIFNFDFPLTFSFQCIWSYDFVDVLFGMTIFPLVVLALLSIAYHFYGSLSTEPSIKRRQKQDACVVGFFSWSFVTLPGAVSTIFRMMVPCETLDTELSASQYQSKFHEDIPTFLRADSSISCNSERYETGFAWAIVMLVFYCLFIPAIYVYYLKRAGRYMSTRYNKIYEMDEFKRSASVSDDDPIENMHAMRDRAVRLRPLKFLFASYKPQYYYWEVVETYRRILLIGVVIICQQGKTMQVIVASVICAACILLYSACDPYQDTSVAFSSKLTSWQTFGLLFVILVNKDEAFSADRSSGIDMAMIMIIAGGVCVEALMLVLPARWVAPKSKYIAIHSEVQLSGEGPPEKEFEDDRDMSFPGDPETLEHLEYSSPVTDKLDAMGTGGRESQDSLQHWNMAGSSRFMRSPSGLSRQDSQHHHQQQQQQQQSPISRSFSGLSRQGSQRQFPISRGLSVQSRQDSPQPQLQSPINRSLSGLSRQGSQRQLPLSRSLSGLSRQDYCDQLTHEDREASHCEVDSNVPDDHSAAKRTPPVSSKFRLRGPALQHAFHQEIAKHSPITIRPEHAAPSTNDIDTPLASSAPHQVLNIGGGAHEDASDDRQRKFKLSTPFTPNNSQYETPVQEMSMSAMDSFQSSLEMSSVGMGHVEGTPLPMVNKGRSHGANRRPHDQQAELLAAKERMLREREELMRENEKMREEISKSAGKGVSSVEDAQSINDLMQQQLVKLNEENRALQRNLRNS